MAVRFFVLGFLIVVNEHDGSASITGGILGILLGAAFLIAHAYIGSVASNSGRISEKEVTAAEIVPQMRQAADAICSF